MTTTGRTFTVKYQNGKEVKVRRLPPAKLEELAELSQSIFEIFYEAWNYSLNCLGDVIGNPACWGYIEQIASLLLIDGQKEPGLDLNLLGDDYEQIAQIFITQSVNLETGEIQSPEEGTVIQPSRLAQLHGQHFFRVRAVRKIEEIAKMQKQSPVVATP